MERARDLRRKLGYTHPHQKGPAMLLSFLLARFNRRSRFVWSPALDLADHEVYSTLIPGTQY